jgi:hypothetical protein
LFSKEIRYLAYESWHDHFGFFAPQKGQESLMNGIFAGVNSSIDFQNKSMADKVLKLSLQNIINNLIIKSVVGYAL